MFSSQSASFSPTNRFPFPHPFHSNLWHPERNEGSAFSSFHVALPAPRRAEGTTVSLLLGSCPFNFNRSTFDRSSPSPFPDTRHGTMHSSTRVYGPNPFPIMRLHTPSVTLGVCPILHLFPPPFSSTFRNCFRICTYKKTGSGVPPRDLSHPGFYRPHSTCHETPVTSPLHVSANSASARYQFSLPLTGHESPGIASRTPTLPPLIYGIIPPHRGNTSNPFRQRGGFSD
jgi:hypothetical protein